MKASESSKGSAISTSLGLAFASFGTETISSIVSPAEKSAIIGFKPTIELILSEGIMTRTVRDAADIMHEVLHAQKSSDWASTKFEVSNARRLKSLKDVIDFTKSYEAEEYPARDVEGLERADKSDPESKLYKDMLAKEEYFAGEGGIADAIEGLDLPVLVMRTTSMTMSMLAAKASSPVMSAPLGYYPPGTKIVHDTKNGLVNVVPSIR
ncbi:hypothetical protein K458DRAFT_460244 [Lentithecium fluviatile CBS 122367]|uniref:Amidase domain-containing protein n=1 Tax=Lentithecium fluviatile CBS 122367 TaxID=1168545 RepID=A0A6G1IPP6_9PLEO|nr:hypothetical protein K458DRAFT_460244 [Lentithecium fluviatile CBS 122367]